ncbi:MAG: lysophospholipase [Hyphomicrobiales bacterium]|nr:lysophospholipase [Hyphomicrobiales bacterium]
MRERDVEIQTDGLTLRGSLTLPRIGTARGIVLCIHGTGPLDRDENMKGQTLDVFNSLAKSLAEAGYGTVRYDKRGCGESDGDYYRAGHFDLVSDALAWATHLGNGTWGRFGPLYLLGHSEGTIIAPQVAQKNGAVSGLVLICPFLQNVEDLLRQQAVEMEKANRDMPGLVGWFIRRFVQLMGGVPKLQDKAIRRFKSTDAPMVRFMLRKFEAKALRELMAIDPRQVYATVTVPTLLFGAEKDVQCDPADVAQIAAALGDLATAHVETDLTHILRKDHGPAGFLAYRKLIEAPMDPCVAEHVLAWLDAR